MPRKSKDVHGKPESAGEQNLPAGYKDKAKDEMQTMAKIMPVYNIGTQNRQNYNGQYDEESLAREIGKYFQYCTDNDVKPAKVGLSLWLGISKQTFYEWEGKPEKYGFKSDLTKQASEAIEFSYMNRLESFPTGNIFLLKALHGVVETNKVEINTTITNTEEICDAISKLGLDK